MTTFNIPVKSKGTKAAAIPINIQTSSEFEWLLSPEPIADIRVVTRELGEELLARNTVNRRRSKGVVNKLAETFSVDYQFTGDTIKISTDGILLDGQHRLTALKKLDWPSVKMVFVRGIQNRAKLYMDQGRKRNIIDSMQIHFSGKIKNRILPIVNYISYHQHGWGAKGRKSINIPEQVEKVLENLEHIERMFASVLSCQSHKNIFANSFYAGFIIVGKETGKWTEIVNFMEQAASGLHLTDSMPAYHLRNVALDKNYSSSSELHRIRVMKTIIATRAHLANKPMKRLYISQNDL
jgi:hypothetical protein